LLELAWLNGVWLFTAAFSFHSYRTQIACQRFVCQATARNAVNGLQKTLAVIFLSVVKPKGFFIQITKQVKRFNADVCALESAF
jgi:hypothetical protein